MPNGKLLKTSADKSLKIIHELELKLAKLERQNKSYSDELEKYKSLADSVYSWEFLQAPTGEFLYLSPSCERITGYPVKSFMEDPDLLLRIIHPRDVSDYLTHHLNSRKQKPGQIRFRIIRDDGEIKYIEHTCRPMYDGGGNFLGTRGSNHETDKLIFPEEVLSDHEKKYRNLFNVMAQGVIHFNSVGIADEVNPAASRLLGFSPEEILGKSISDQPWSVLDENGNVCLPENLPIAIAFSTGRRSDRKIGITNRVLDKTVWINLVASPETDNESVLGIFAAFDDISSHLEIQNAQEEVNREVISHSHDLEMKIRDRIVEIVQLSNLNQAIVNSLGLALITVSQDGIVTGFNREAESLLGYMADEIIEKVNVVLFHKKEELMRVAEELSVSSGTNVLPDFELFKVLCAQSSGKPVEWTYVRKNRSEVPVLLSLSYLRDPDGTVTGFLGVAFDNSVRKDTEELLRWKEHLLRLMSDSSPYGFLVTDINSGKVLYFNHRFCEIWNFLSCEGKMKAGEMDFDTIVSSFRPLIKGKAPITVLETNMTEYDENEVLRDEVQLIDGRSVGLFLTKINSEFGEYHGHFYIFEDITERKLTEKKLQLQNAAFESVALGVLISDLQGYIMWVNPAFTRLTGYPVEEAIGQHTRMLKSGKMSSDFYKNLWETILNGNVWTGEFINRKKDGTIYYEVETITPIFNDRGEVSRFISVKIDITNRIQMESALRISEARWQAALEGSGYGIWDYNIITEEIFYSSKWKEMLGFSDDEIPNKFNEWPDRVHPEDLQRLYDALNSHLSGLTEFYTCEYRMRCKDGSFKWILDRGKVIEWVGKDKPSRLIGTHTDIDERKRLETSLKESIAKEKELNEMKSRFVSTASHEFRTPLSSILITSDSLLTYWERMEGSQIRDKLTKINNQVLHLTKIVNDVLQLSKIEEGRVEFNPVDIDIIDLCRQVIDSFNSDPKLNYKVTLATPFSSLIMNLDSRLIFQVINNLVSNGIKYSSENPGIKIEVTRKNNELCLTVTDNGIGIPEQDQKHLFKPFYRASNTTMIQGNGLGLSIVKESVMLHGGKITFKSRVGQGTSFYITFPDKLVKSYK